MQNNTHLNENLRDAAIIVAIIIAIIAFSYFQWNNPLG
jgi:hypothetical protein